MGETYPIAGIYENIQDKSSYSLMLGGNQVFIPFTALKGVYGVPKTVFSTNDLYKIWGYPYTDGLFASSLIVKMTPVLGLRVGWISPTINFSSFTNLSSYLKDCQHLDGTDPTYLSILQRRSGAFEIYRTTYVGDNPSLHLSSGNPLQLISGTSWASDINSILSLTGLNLEFDPNNFVWYGVWTPAGGVSTTIYGIKSDVNDKIYFFKPNSGSYITIALDANGTISPVNWTLNSGDSFKLYCYVIPSTTSKVNISLLRGYLYGGDPDADFDGNSGSWGKDINIYLSPATYDLNGNLETVSITILDKGIVVENFVGLDIQTDPTNNNSLEKYIEDNSNYIRLYKDSVDGHVDLTNLRSLTKNDFTTNPTNHTYYSGMLFSVTALTRLHVKAISCDPNLFSYYDLVTLNRGNHIYEGTNTIYRNAKGCDDISYYDTSLTEYKISDGTSVTLTSATIRSAVVSSLTNDYIPKMNNIKYDFNLAWSSIQDDNDSATVHNALLSLSEKRNDFFFFTDLQGSGVAPTTSEECVQLSQNLDSNWRYAIHAPRLLFKNNFTQKKVYLGTGFGGLYATVYNDLNGYAWNAPAGFTRGKIKDAIGVEFELTEDDAKLLYGYPNRINPIINFPVEGLTVWGQKTAQIKPSALDRINVARALLFIMKSVKTVTKYLIFEQTTQDLFAQFISLVDPILKDVLKKNGLYDYKIVMSFANNTSDTIDRNEVHGAILLKFTKTGEKFIIDYITTPTGADFNLYLV